MDPCVYHVDLLEKAESETLHLWLQVSLTICLVVFILLVTFAYLRYKHREDRY